MLTTKEQEYRALGRPPYVKELAMLRLLVSRSTVPVEDAWEEGLLVAAMNDGGMGSLYLMPKSIALAHRIMGTQVSEFQFVDSDGVAVIVSLNLDEEGRLFELDIWKTDYNRLLSLPEL
jgi:hypothetical protein